MTRETVESFVSLGTLQKRPDGRNKMGYKREKNTSLPLAEATRRDTETSDEIEELVEFVRVRQFPGGAQTSSADVVDAE